MSEKNGTDKANFTNQCRTPTFLLNIITVILMMVVVGMIALYLFEGRAQNEEAIQTGKDAKVQIQAINETVVKLNQSFFSFIDTYTARQVIGNERANATLEGFNNLTKYLQTVLKVQLNNEKNIIGNLTDHRIIQNLTRDDDARRQNETLSTLQDIENSTQTLITKFNATNEQERGKAVDTIIGNLTAVIREQLSNKTG